MTIAVSHAGCGSFRTLIHGPFEGPLQLYGLRVAWRHDLRGVHTAEFSFAVNKLKASNQSYVQYETGEGAIPNTSSATRSRS